MELGYEERSRKLIERLDRIQNYLKSLPPLPKIGSVSEAMKARSKEFTQVLSSASSQMSDKSTDSVGSSTQGSVSTKPSRSIPKDCDGRLLQRITSASPETSASSRSFSAGNGFRSEGSSIRSERITAPSPPVPEIVRKRKKKRRDPKIQDPLRPTERRSFGVDIGQGMNVINYIKQNATLGCQNKSSRLANIITREVPRAPHTEISTSRVFRQGPLTADASSASLLFRNRESDASRIRSVCGKQKESSNQRIQNTADSMDMMYRVRIIEKPVELPNNHGLDALQELFVPYLEHDPDPELEPHRNPSDFE